MDAAGQPEPLPAQPLLSEQPCLNCGDPTEGNYCRLCGQRKVEHRVALKAMLRDTLQDQFALTVELPRTLRVLFTRPGFLSTEYSAGRIARYIEPLRLYLIASVTVFLLLSVLTSMGRNRMEEQRAAREAREATQPKPPSPVTPKKPAMPVRRSNNAAVDRCFKANPGALTFCTPLDPLNKLMAPRVRELNKLPPGEAGKRISDFILARSSVVMFMLLPLLAGLLKLAFWRTRRFYTEHFVFALHVHAFVFFVFAMMLMMPKFRNFQYVNRMGLVWMAVYALFALKRFYGQSWLRTGAKFMALSVAYSVLFITAIIAEVIVAFYVA